HYYAMQFIQGQGLDGVLKAVKRLRGQKDPPSAESPEAGAELSQSLARGLLSGQFAGAGASPSPPAPPRPPAAPAPAQATPPRPPSGASLGRSYAPRAARGRSGSARRTYHRPGEWDGVDGSDGGPVLPQRGPDGGAGRGGLGLRPQGGGPAPGHQAVEPAAR